MLCTLSACLQVEVVALWRLQRRVGAHLLLMCQMPTYKSAIFVSISIAFNA